MKNLQKNKSYKSLPGMFWREIVLMLKSVIFLEDIMDCK
jgi:hypothetical protein